MSAIFGAIDLSGSEIEESLGTGLKSAFEKYTIDRFENLLNKNVYMGCGIQYFYPQAKNEKLPLYDERRQLFYDADCVLDNRKELLEEFYLPSSVPDGEIIYEAYLKWGMDCLDHLEGVFCFVIYDAKNNQVILVNDHFANRSLFYHVRDNRVYFSTTMFPILKNTGLKFEENERWLLDSISVRGPVMMVEPKETALVGIYKVVAGSYVTLKLTEDGFIKTEETRYYDPANKIKVDKTITPEEGGRLIREALTRSVENVLGQCQNVATELSSGLDSSTIACIAAGLLEKQNKDLHSFTSVPLEEANLPKNGYFLFDEREGVLTICDKYPNIIPQFVETKGRSYLREAEEIVKDWELPCMSQQNAVWIDEIHKLAAKDGNKILLSGATGNCTCSAGSIESTAFYYLTHFKFKQAYRTFDAVKKMGVSRKYYVKQFWGPLKQYYKYYIDKNSWNSYANIVTRHDIGEKYNLNSRYNKKLYHIFPISTEKAARSYIYLIDAYAQIGEVDTKLSLKYGILPRDPMRNQRVIETCLSLPMECFASSDYDRRLIRVGMEGIVPEEILKDVLHRGRQSGDNFFRLKKDYPCLKEKIQKNVYSNGVLKYLDKKKLDDLFENIEKTNFEKNTADTLYISELFSFGIYLNLIGENQI